VAAGAEGGQVRSARDGRRELPSGWTCIGFENATRVVSTTGKKVQKRDYLSSGRIPVVDQGHDFVGGYTDEFGKCVECEPPVIVFGDHTRVFKFVEFRFVAGADGVKVLKPIEAFWPRLFYYFLQVLELPDRGYSRHFRFLRRETLPLPPWAEQCRILDVLETELPRLDAAVTALEQADAKLKRYRASVLQAACEGRLVPTEAELAREEGRAYEPADELLERILEARRAKWEEERWDYEIERAKKKAAQAERKAAGLPYYIRDLEPEHWEHRTPEEYEPYLPKGDKWKDKYDEPEPPDTDGLPELPEGWAWTSLGQAFRVYVGSTPRRSRPEYWNGTIPWVRSGEVAFCRIGRTAETITQLGLENSSTELHPPGTVLLGMIGEGKTRGQPAILDTEAAHNQNCAAIRVSEVGAVPEYVYYVLAKEYEHNRGRGSGGNQPALSKTRVQAIPFALPPVAEQHRIVEEVERRLSVVDVLEQSLEANLTRAQRLRQAILKKAFEGRLVPQDPDDEPASVLLERITSSRKAAKPQRG